MNTPYLDSHLEGLKKLKKNNKISKHGKGLLIELTEIKKQLSIQGVTFCLLTKEDKTFEDWVHNNFEKQGNCFVNKINETVTYSQDVLIDLYDFYCDRTIAN